MEEMGNGGVCLSRVAGTTINRMSGSSGYSRYFTGGFGYCRCSKRVASDYHL